MKSKVNNFLQYYSTKSLIIGKEQINFINNEYN